MWSVFVNVMKKVLKVGAQSVQDIIFAYNPVLGMLVQSIVTSVVQAEAGGYGAALAGIDKKQAALAALQVAMPAIAAAFTSAGKPIANPVLFAEGVEKLQDGLVAILNSTGEGTKAVA